MGAAFTGATFPLFAASLESVANRERVSKVFLWLGLALGSINALFAFARSPVPHIALGILTIGFLVAAVYVSLAWIGRVGASSGHGKAGMKHKWMLPAVFGLPFAVTAFFDFMGGSYLIDPRLQGHFVFFPAFSMFLFIFVSRAYLRTLLRPASEKKSDAAQVIASGDIPLRRYGISPRETEIAVLLAKGLTYREMGDELFISLATVKSHMTHLFDKTGARNKVELLNRLGK